MPSAQAREIVNKLADYTVTAGDMYGLLTNRGAATMTWTLPDPSAALTGVWVETFNIGANGVTLRAVSASKLTVFNNAAATSIAWSTAGNIIGSGCTATCDGTTWLIHLNPGTTSAAQTAAQVTIA